jgi:PAS domain S-box-containing protein
MDANSPHHNDTPEIAGVSFCPVLSTLPAGPQLGEDSFRRVVEWAPSAMIMINRDGVIVLVNTQAEKMFNYDRTALIGQSVEALVPERFRSHHVAYRAGFFGDPKARPMGVGRDLAGCRADGSEFPIEIGLNPIDTEAGAMVLASIIDITERQRAQQRLEDALREKTVLLNEVHHRVKNNLQVITSLLNLQADHATNPELRAMLAESCGRVKAMALTHQLLYERKDFSRLDLGDYLERLMQSIRATYRGTSSRISVRMALPSTTVQLDLERTIPCGLLLNELVTNSFKHAFPDERSGEILIELGEVSDALIHFCVSDDGVGLPPESELASHASLGLQLVPLLIEQIQGSLEITRENGTKFCIRFPNTVVAKETS